MINQELTSYIEQSRQSGIADDVIRTNLSNAGWQTEQIEEAINTNLDHDRINSEVDKFSHPGKKSKKWLIVVLSIVVVLLLISGTFLFFNLSNKKTDNKVSSQAINTEPKDNKVNPSTTNFKTDHDLLIEAEKKRENATQRGQYEINWDLMHPDFQKAYWNNNKDDYIKLMKKRDELSSKNTNASIKSFEIVRVNEGLFEQNGITGKTYNNVARVTFIGTLTNGETSETEISWLKTENGWKFFSTISKNDLEALIKNLSAPNK